MEGVQGEASDANTELANSSPVAGEVPSLHSAVADQAPASGLVEVHVHLLSGKQLGVMQLAPRTCVWEIKAQLVAILAILARDSSLLQLFWEGAVLGDESTLSELGVYSGAVLQLVRSPGESIRVVLRCRPMVRCESAPQVLHVNAEESSVKVHTNQECRGTATFTLDAVYGESCSQEQLFEGSVRGIVESVMCGQSGAVFAFGQTGTGKRYTIFGGRPLTRLNEGTASAEADGLLPRSFCCMASHMRLYPGVKYVIQVSFLSIYRNRVYDLLSAEDQPPPVKLRTRPDMAGAFAEGLTCRTVRSTPEMRNALCDGLRQLTIILIRTNRLFASDMFSIALRRRGAARLSATRR